MVRSIGTDQVIDHTQDDFTNALTRKGTLIVKDLIEAGEVTPVIDRTYPMSEVPEAIRHLGDGHGRGKAVITVAAVD